MTKVTAAEIKAWRTRLYWANHGTDEALLADLYTELSDALAALGDGLSGPVKTFWKVVDLRREVEDAQASAVTANKAVADFLAYRPRIGITERGA